MAFFALTACLALTPMTTQAQTSVPYTTTVGGEYPPGGWIANYYGSLYYNGWEYYGFQTGPIVLPEFNAPTNTLTVDVQVKPFWNIPLSADFSIGYYTNVNDLDSFQSVEVFNYNDESWNDEWRFKRAVLSNVPANARIGFYAWYPCFINLVYVHETPDPFDVPYNTLSGSWDSYQPEGWIANNWMASSERWFRSGTAALPKFTSALNTLQLDISLKPRNSNSQSIQIGYLDDPDDPSSSFTTLQTFNYSSSWDDYLSKRISYSGVPSGKRMAFRCTGEWIINSVGVTTISSTTTYPVPYQPNLSTFVPDGWLASNYGYSGNAYLTSGTAVLPQFNISTNLLEMDVSIRPKNADATSISIGYVTNNNPSNFSVLTTYYYASEFSRFQPKRISFSSAPSGARMAFRCNGDWEIRNLKVKTPTTTVGLPYTPTLGDPIPDGWVTSSYYIHYNGETYLSGYTVLPRPDGSAYQFDLSLKPANTDAQSVKIGYVTNANSPSSTFTPLQTFNYESTWNNFESKRVLISSLPSGARPAILCNGFWYVRDLSVHAQPSAATVPYDVSLESVQPDGWLANNYSYYSGAYLKTGTALLRVFSPALNQLQLDLSLKPNNSNAQSIQIGYINSSNTFVALQTYSYLSSWSGYQPKSISYAGVPSGARMAIKCTGEWSIATVHVDYIPGTVPYPVPYEPALGTLLPGGWSTSSYYYSNGAYLTTGYTALPAFVPNLNTLQLDIKVKPRNSNAQSIQFGYLTSSNTFVALQTFNYSTTWSSLRHKRILYNTSGVPTNARMAIYCSGEWSISYLSVDYIPDPISAPYTCDCYDNCVGTISFGNSQPPGWVANTFAAGATGMQGVLFESGCVMLPQFTTAINSLQFRMDIVPYVGFDGVTPTSISMGYVTNNNPSTFVACQTFNYSSNWGVPVAKTVTFPSAPSNARIAFYCNGNWRCDNFHVTMPIQSIPYSQTFESTSANELPLGWSASNMSVKYGSYNGVSTYGGYYQLVGSGYALLPFFDAELNTTTIEFWCRPESTSNGGIVRVGYVPNGGSVSSFVSVKDITWNSDWTGYRLIRVSYKNVPTGARAVIYGMGYGSNGTNLFHFDNFQVKQPPVLTVPHTQNFNSVTLNSLPDGWLADNIRAGYQPYGNDAPHSGNRQLYGTGVVVLPEISGGIEGLQVDLWLRPSTSSSDLLFCPGYVTNPNDPSTFVALTAFSGYNWTTYQQKHVSFTRSSSFPTGARMAFKAVASGTNCWYIDDISISEFNNAAPTLTLNNAASHFASISWVPGSNGQEHWDVFYTDWEPYNIEQYTIAQLEEIGTLLHISNSQYNYTINNLTAGGEYYVWVRYRWVLNGTTLETSLWSNPVYFETVGNCAPPTNIQVETTLHTVFVSWEPGQSNQTSWIVQISGSDYWEYETDETSIEIDVEGMFEPGEEFQVGVQGNCTGNDGTGQSEWIDAQMQDYPSSTVNSGSDTEDAVPINGSACGAQKSRTQFIIPASRLTEIQYSHIKSLTFDNQQYTYGQPWGEDAQFDVYLKEVDWDDFSDGQFYDWDDLTLVYSGRLSISAHLMTLIIDDFHSFYYNGGNLLVGFYQEEYDFTPGTNASHLDWLGVNYYNSNPNYKPSIYYNTSTNQPFACTFLPKVSFTYETDDYLPPTDFEAEVTGSYEVSFSWTMRDEQTATQIMINDSPNFDGNGFVYSTGNSYCTLNRPAFFQPETTYYYRYRGLYSTSTTTYYSAWSPSDSFTMPEACDPPTDPQVTQVKPFSALLSWNGGGESDYVEYREAVGETLQTVISQGFERIILPSGWSVINSGGGSGWEMAYTTGSNSLAHTGRGCIGSTNTNSNTYGVANSWLFIPVSDLRGYLTFWTRLTTGVAQNRLEVYYTTSPAVPSDNTNRLYYHTFTSTVYAQVSVDFSELQGSGYIAIHHLATNTSSATGIVIDDLEFQNYVTDYSEWIALGSTEYGQFDLVGLTPGTTYQARVRSLCDTGFTSEWTEPVNFSTPGNIVFTDVNVKAICVANWDTNDDGELSFAEAAAVTDLGATFGNNSTITSFNELQYFTGLTTIGSDAFEGCASLAAITLPNTITSIGYNAFGSNSQVVGCSSLTSIVIPSSVQTIGDYAFQNSGLTEINLPYSVTTIGTLAFGYCNSLESISLPATVTHIDGNAFTGSSIASIVVDAGNPVYDSRGGCNAIIETATNTLKTGCKNTIVPDGVTIIGISAFENCSGLTDISLPATLETIEDWGFANCTGLTTIEVQATTPPTFDEMAFQGAATDILVYVPCGYLEVYEDTDWSDFDLVENCIIVFEDPMTKQICVAEWDRNHDGELSYWEAAVVTSLDNVFSSEPISRFNELQYFTGLDMISEDDFADCFNLVAVTFPPTVWLIDNHAFFNCEVLTSITFGENIGTIQNLSFENCTGLTFVKVEAITPPSLGETAFQGAATDIPVYVPCGTKSAYQNDSDWDVFDNDNFVDMCDNIVFADVNVKALCVANWDTNNDGELSYAEAAAVTDLGEVFRSNEDIHTFNELQYFTGLTEIGEEAFYGCPQLNAVTMPVTVTSIGSLAFWNTPISSVNLPTSLWSIGFAAFDHCHSLTSVTIPASVTYLDGNVFSYCENLNTITVQSGNPIYNDGNGLDVIIETATNTLVTGCQNTIIEDGITKLGDYSFGGQTSFSSITIPASVTELGNGVFENVTDLAVIYVEATTPPTMGYEVFYNLNLDDVMLYVPCESVEEYQVAPGWSEFPNIQCDQEILTVYDGTDLNNRIPAYIYYFDDFTRSQFVIPAADLEEMTGRPIRSMTFYTYNANIPYTTGSNADVYLMEVDYTEIDAYESKADATLVYSGRFNIKSAGDGGKMTINFTTPYIYQGGNLLVGIENTEDNVFNQIYFYGQQVTGASISGSNGSSLASVPAQQQNFIPKTTFVYLPSSCEPKDLPYAYGFEDASELDCWTLLQCDNNTGLYSAASHFGNNGFRFYYNLTPPQYLISPEFEGTSSMNVSFFYKNYNDTYPETFQVGYSMTTKSPEAFIWGAVITANDQSHWMLYENSFPEGTKYVAVKLLSNDQYMLFLDDFSFEPACLEPSELTVANITSNSADVLWTGNQDNYNVRYKAVSDDSWSFETVSASHFEDGFEHGLGNWTMIDADGDGHNWMLHTDFSVNGVSPHEGGDMAISESWTRVNGVGTVLYPDNYLVSPQVTFTMGKTVSFWASAEDANDAAEHFGIAVSTGSNTNPSDFTMVQEWTMTAKGGRHDGPRGTRAQGAWYQYTVDLSAFDGQTGYIAIRHFNCSDQYILAIDDFSYGDEAPGITLLGLDPGTTYEVQVQGICPMGHTQWSEVVTFTTEGPAAVTQTMALSAGWNWFSTYLEVENPVTMLQAVEASLGGNGVEIRNSHTNTEYDSEWGWWGDLDEEGMTNEQMYKILVSSPCTIILEGTPANPAEHPITINPGWNWIGFPSGTQISLENAFAGFAQEGDRIRNSGAQIEYDPDWGWFGDFETLVPGQGYMYYSASNTPRTLLFPSAK